MGSVVSTVVSNVADEFCTGDLKGLSIVALHMPVIDDLVTPWLLAIQVNWILSPTLACIANGTKRRTP